LIINDHYGRPLWNYNQVISWNHPANGFTLLRTGQASWGFTRSAYEAVQPGIDWNGGWRVQIHFEWLATAMQHDLWYWGLNCEEPKQTCGMSSNSPLQGYSPSHEMYFCNALDDLEDVQGSWVDGGACVSSKRTERPMYWEISKTIDSQRVNFDLYEADGTVIYKSRTTHDISFSDDHACPISLYWNSAWNINIMDVMVSGSGSSNSGSGGDSDSSSAVGDPHLQNVHGEKFDLMKPGRYVLINIPRGGDVDNTLLRVEADARRLGGHCADMYFQELNITGSWAYAKQAGWLLYQANGVAQEPPKWVTFGTVEMKVSHGRTPRGVRYLNFYVKHLRKAGYAIGGLLGEDDHEDVSVRPAECARHATLQSRDVNAHSSVSYASSVAFASLA